MNERLKPVLRTFLETIGTAPKTEEDKLRLEIADLSEKLMAGEKLVKDFEQDMFRRFNVIHTQLISKSAELKDLEEQLKDFAEENDIILDDEDDLDDAEFDEDDAQDRDEEAEALKKLRGSSASAKYCKRLYQKISSVCHPDRTNDPDRNELFRQAHAAYKKLDALILEAIHKQVLRGTAVSVVNLAINALRDQRDSLVEKVLDMQDDGTYMMAVVYNHGDDERKKGVMRIARTNLLNSLETVEQRIELARWKLSKARGQAGFVD